MQELQRQRQLVTRCQWQAGSPLVSLGSVERPRLMEPHDKVLVGRLKGWIGREGRHFLVIRTPKRPGAWGISSPPACRQFTLDRPPRAISAADH